VEIRVDADDNPHVLELNGNPSWPANSCLAQLAGLIGIDYGDLPKEIISLTIKRYQDRFKNLGREGKR
jgi:D-alanine-D-alanine ligase-like ATP-grasp enzyme